MSKQQDQKTLYINYHDAIDMRRVSSLMAIIAHLLEKEHPDVLYFLFSSPGGEVDAGITLYNFLKSLPVKIIMHNIGSIDSIANVIFVAGEKRFANPYATFMFHGVQQPIQGATVLSLPAIKEIKDRIDKNHTTIASIICDNSKVDEGTIKNLFAEGETKHTDFALEKGIIDKVELAQIPEGALFVSINIDG